MFAIFVCIVALIAKVTVLLIAWSVSHTLLLVKENYKLDFENAEFDGYETIQCTGRDCPMCRG